jgi:hypothetical protein
MKKNFLWLLLTLTLLASGCNSITSPQQYTYHKDGRAKPKVALLPVIDSSESDLPWSLSKEFTEGLQGRFVKQSNLFLLHDYNLVRLKKSLNPFTEESSWLQEMETSAEFVVFVELAEHHLISKIDESLFNITNAPSYNLSVNVRVKVVDIRQKQPKTILQEMFQENYTIPWQLSSIDYEKTTWGKTSFFISPMGLAHAGLIRKISQQIEDYILLAQTR